MVGMNGSGRSPAALTWETVAADVRAGHHVVGRGESRGGDNPKKGLPKENQMDEHHDEDLLHATTKHPELLPETVPADSVHAVTVPGAVAGYLDFLDKFGSGRVSLDQIIAPAIDLCEQGHVVHEWTASCWQKSETFLSTAGGNGEELLVTSDRSSVRAPKTGELMRNPGLAAVLKRIGKHGKKGFYEGETAERIVEIHQNAATTQNSQSCLTLADLKQHGERGTTFEERPLSCRFAGKEVWEIGPNGQGIVALIALKIVEARDQQFPNRNLFRAETETAKTVAARLHVMIEALKLGFCLARMYVQDPEFFQPLGGGRLVESHQHLCAQLLSDELAANLASLIADDSIVERWGASWLRCRLRDWVEGKAPEPPLSPTRKAGGAVGGVGAVSNGPSDGRPEKFSLAPLPSTDTTFFTVMDAAGNATSFIQSNYAGFGTNLVPKGCGFTLQNRGANFVLRDRSHPNAVAGGKRPTARSVAKSTTNINFFMKTATSDLVFSGGGRGWTEEVAGVKGGSGMGWVTHFEYTPKSLCSQYFLLPLELVGPYHTIIPGMVTVPTGASGPLQQAATEPAATTSTSDEDSCPRPRHDDHQLHCVFGNMGGFMQPQGHLQLLVNMLKLGMCPQRAIDCPRFCLGGAGDRPMGWTDRGDPRSTEEDLRNRNVEGNGVLGHAVRPRKMASSGGEEDARGKCPESDAELAMEAGFDPQVVADLARRGHTKIRYPVDGVGRALFGRAQIIGYVDSLAEVKDRIKQAGSESRCDGMAFFAKCPVVSAL